MGGHGSGGHYATGRKKEEPDVPSDAPFAEVEMPAGMSSGEQAVWNQLAPLAIQERTLTEVTAERFRLLCRAIVREGQMDEQIQKDGWTYQKVTIDGSGQEHTEIKAHPLCGQHRGMMQRCEAGMVAFRLSPTGKALATKQKDKPKSALELLQSQRVRAIG
jgi:hypothetical protein